MNKISKVEEYFDSLSVGDGKSPHTIRGYRGTINKLTAYFEITSIDQIISLTEKDFVDFYKECGKGNTLNTHIRNLSAFFHWLFGEDYPKCAFAKTTLGGKKFDKVPKKFRAVLSKDEIERAIAAGLNIQEKLMVAMMFKTALRNSEVANIKMSDISGCEITITGKGGDQAHTYLNEQLCGMLKEYVEKGRNTDSEYLFYGVRGVGSSTGKLTGESINHRVQACVARAGINKDVTAHTTRRTAITHMSIERNPYAAQMLGRHKDIKTTMGYVFSGDEFVREMLLG